MRTIVLISAIALLASLAPTPVEAHPGFCDLPGVPCTECTGAPGMCAACDNDPTGPTNPGDKCLLTSGQ